MAVTVCSTFSNLPSLSCRRAAGPAVARFVVIRGPAVTGRRAAADAAAVRVVGAPGFAAGGRAAPAPRPPVAPLLLVLLAALVERVAGTVLAEAKAEERVAGRTSALAAPAAVRVDGARRTPTVARTGGAFALSEPPETERFAGGSSDWEVGLRFSPATAGGSLARVGRLVGRGIPVPLVGVLIRRGMSSEGGGG